MSNTDTQLLLRLSADVSRFQKQMARIMDAGEATAVGVEERFRTSNRRMSRSAEQSGQAIAKEMDRLRAKYDPLYAASQRYARELEGLNRAHKVGALSTQQHEAALERLNAEYARATGNGQQMAAAGQGVKRSMAGMGGGLQNVSYQVADFATQVGAGTSASMALGQQLPQLLAGFGVMGAVLGAVAAVALPLGAALLSTGDASETLEEQISELRSSVDDYVNAVQDAALPTAEIAEKYGAATEAARDFVRALRDVTEANARDAANRALDRVARQFGGFDDVARGPMQMNQGWTELTKTIEAMSKALGISKAQAEALAPAFERLDETDGAKERTEAARALLKALEAALGPAEDMTAEQRKVYENIALSADEMARFVGAADGASAGISAAASEAARLADELGRAVENAIELAAQGISDATRARISYEFREDPKGRAAALARERFDAQVQLPPIADNDTENIVRDQRREFVRAAVEAEEYRQRLIAWRKEQAKASRSSRSGSSSRKGKKVEPLFQQSDKELQQIERNIEMIGKTSAEIAELQARYELLDEAKKRGLDLDAEQAASGETLRQEIERQAKAIGDLTGQYDQATERAKFFDGQQDQIKSGMIDAIVEGENLAGTLENVAKALAKAALQAALFGEGPLAGLMGATGGGVLGSITGSRAAGGAVQAGGVYRVNEHGEELFVPAVGGRILSAEQTKQALAAGAPEAEVPDPVMPATPSAPDQAPPVFVTPATPAAEIAPDAPQATPPAMPGLERAALTPNDWGLALRPALARLTSYEPAPEIGALDRLRGHEMLDGRFAAHDLGARLPAAQPVGEALAASTAEPGLIVKQGDVHVNNYAGAEVSTRRDEAGNTTIDIRREMNDLLRSGAADGAMKSRYGARPKPQGR